MDEKLWKFFWCSTSDAVIEAAHQIQTSDAAKCITFSKVSLRTNEQFDLALHLKTIYIVCNSYVHNKMLNQNSMDKYHSFSCLS